MTAAAADPSRGVVVVVVVASASLLRFFALLVIAVSVGSVRSFQPSSLPSSASAAAFRRGSPTRSIASNLGRSAPVRRSSSSFTAMSSATEASSSASATVPSWSDLRTTSTTTPVGSALTTEAELRLSGLGPAHVSNTLRLFDSPGSGSDAESKPKLTVWRDQAGWCPYCQKTMLLIEEKNVPVQIGLVPMRSYGDKPREFLNMVPSGLLPALTVESDDGRKQVITESAVIMELLDRWHPKEDGYPSMLPDSDDQEGNAKYDRLAGLERELFSRWCNLLFRPEGGPVGGGGGGILGMLTGTKNDESSEMSGAMRAFLECLTRVDDALTSTSGPWFFSDKPHPTMIDFVYVSHLERMLASCAYWKGLDLRSPEWSSKYPGINAWFDAFEKRECYLAFKSDYYTHVKDIPPQYGPGYDGGFEERREKYSRCVLGTDGKSWNLPLPHDDPLQPLYRGLPLPLAALEAAGITPDADGSYTNADPKSMDRACRQMAAWKLANNGEKVSNFAARGGPDGSRNPRKTFGAELADPYASPDESIVNHVDAALRIVCSTLLFEIDGERNEASLSKKGEALRNAVPTEERPGVQDGLRYLRDRVGVPRDLPLASARQLRAHLNWAIDAIG